MIKNNSISIDTQGERIERLALLSANIDDFAVNVGVSGVRLTAAQNAKEDYLDAIAEAGVQDGQMDEAFEEFHKGVDDLTQHYAKAKDHLLAIIWELEKPDDFIEAYGFRGRSPYRYPGLLAKIKTWKSNHDTLVAAGDPRVLTDAAMTNLLAKYDAMDALRTVAYVEKHESNVAYAALHELYDAHTKLMDFIYTGAVLAWGDDDSRLRLLGFLPSSEVHTPGNGDKLPAVQNITLNYVDPDLTISWDAVEGATGYTVQMGSNPMILTKTIYVGPDTSYTFDPPGGHPHYFRVWAMDGETWGERGDAVDIEIEGVAPNPPINFKLTREGVYVKCEWKTTGDVPKYCRLYIEIVATGSPPPVKPDEPDTDEIITNQVSIFAPGAGNTVYAWVTAFGDGEESDPCGPEAIEIS